MPAFILKMFPVLLSTIGEVLAVGFGKKFFIKSTVYIIEHFGDKLVKKTEGQADDKMLGEFLRNVKEHYDIK